MRRLPPGPVGAFDLAELDDRSDRVAPPERPWVMANMVMSVDGAYAVDGRSGGLGSDADHLVFHRLRAASDAILAAAGTARAERYRRPRMQGDALARRRAHGWSDDPRLVLVSASLSLPDDLPLLEGDGQVPLVLHPEGAPTDDVPAGVELRAAGSGDGVDLHAAMGSLRRDGIEVLLCEGGPSLLGQLHTEDLLDELFVTISPNLVGGTTVGLLGHHPALPRRVQLHRLLEAEGSLFATYRRS